MNHEPASRCAKSDAVLARHLDGDLGGDFDDGYAFACGETLHAHLCACDPCQQTLRRARRLDAALAGAAGRAIADHVAGTATSWQLLEARWWRAVGAVGVVAAQTPAAREPVQRRTAPSLRAGAIATAVAVLAAGIVASWPAAVREVASARDAATLPATAPPVAGTPQPPAPMPLAADAVQRWRRHAEAAVPEQAVPTVAELSARLAAAATTPAERLDAAKLLFAAARPAAPTARAAHRAAIEALAGCGDRDAAACQLHRELLDLGRAAPHVTGPLAAWLAQLDAPATTVGRDELAAVIAGTRLGTRELDAAVRRVVRRHPDTANAVAAALRSEPRDDGGAALLLDLWHDLAVRGAHADDERVAPAWFAGQPPVTFAQVAAELRGCRSAPRRQRCLLALGQSPDPGALAILLEHARSPHHDEAHAAAFAIAAMPHALLATVAPLAGDDDAFLLRAALARAGLPAAQPWLHALSLQPAELARVRGCAFAEFSEITCWFRERGAAAD